MNNRTIIVAVATFAVLSMLICALPQATGSVSADDTVATDPAEVYYTFTLTFRYSGEGAKSITWNFGDGTPESHEFSVTHTFPAVGIYTVTQTVSNEKGEASDKFVYDIRGDPTVKFDSAGGSAVATAVVPLVKGVPQLLAEPTAPTRDGWTFDGWYKNMTDKWNFAEDKVSEHITLVAGWLKGIYVEEMPSEGEIEDMIGKIKNVEYFVPKSTLDTKFQTIEDTVIAGMKSDESITVNVYDDSSPDNTTMLTWFFDGSADKNEGSMSEVNLAATWHYGTDVADQKKAADLIGAKRGYYVDFAASGVLPLDTEVTIYVGDEFSPGDELIVCYYDESTKSMEQGDIVHVASDEYVTFTLHHCSTYALLSFADMSQGGIDMTTIIVIAIFGVLIAAIIGYRYFVGKKEA